MEKLVPKLRFKEFEGEWRSSNLGKISKISSGSTPLRSNKMFFEKGTINWVKTTDLNNSYINQTEEKVSEYALKNTSLKLNPVNTILVAMYGGFNQIGRTGILRISAATNQALSTLQVDQKQFYPMYVLNWLNAKVDIWKQFAGSTRKDPNIKGSDVSEFPISFPTLAEQTKIAEFLTAIDKRIELLTAKKEKLTLYKKGVMQKIFNQELRFKDEQGQAFPDWEEKRLGEVGSIVKLKNKENQITQVFTNSAKYGVVDQGDFFDREITTEVNLKNYYIIDVGQFVYNPRISNLAPVGPISMNKIGKGLLSPLYTVFSILTGDLAFFEQYFKSSFWHQYIRDNGNSGARSDRMSVTVNVLMNLPLFVPSLIEQNKIASFLTSLDVEIQKLDQQITLNQTYKKGLLQQMFV